MSYLASALEQAQEVTGPNSCPPSALALRLWDELPDVVKPFLRPPRGVKKEGGEYLGSIIQVAKGVLGRLHGPALEIFTMEICKTVLSMDEREKKEKEKDPFHILVEGELYRWDVRRYSSSQQGGKWVSIPDYSLYLEISYKELREELGTEEEEQEEQPRRRRM